MLLKRIIMTTEPTWHNSRVLESEPGELELQLEGPFVHVRVHGHGPRAIRLRQAVGKEFIIRSWDQAVVADEDKPKK